MQKAQHTYENLLSTIKFKIIFTSTLNFTKTLPLSSQEIRQTLSLIKGALAILHMFQRANIRRLLCLTHH